MQPQASPCTIGIGDATTADAGDDIPLPEAPEPIPMAAPKNVFDRLHTNATAAAAERRRLQHSSKVEKVKGHVDSSTVTDFWSPFHCKSRAMMTETPDGKRGAAGRQHPNKKGSTGKRWAGTTSSGWGSQIETSRLSH